MTATPPRWEGSSPLTRGKLQLNEAVKALTGLIPAHAGKTLRRDAACPRPWAHPRSRGENAAEETAVDIHLGSSPLTRGKLKRATHPRGHVGLIPAHAGKTTPDGGQAGAYRAHPRSRGENDTGDPSEAGASGSSPLTRGKRSYGEAGSTWDGLIPAHAGKTRRRGSRSLPLRAHPRSRGENAAPTPSRTPVEGSSPLTRGKQQTAAQVHGHVGLIPAHAGKTLPDLRFYRADRSDLGKP